MNPIVVIPARMGSTRLPGKPLAEINGKAMILHMLDRGQAARNRPSGGGLWRSRDRRNCACRRRPRSIDRSPHCHPGPIAVHAALAELDPDRRHDVVVNLQGDLPTLDPEALRLGRAAAR